MSAQSKHTPTPRTDAAEKMHRFLASPYLPEGCLDKPFADFARTLERENARLTAENEALRDQLDRLASAIFWAREALLDVSKSANTSTRKECARQAEILDRDLAELRATLAAAPGSRSASESSTNTEGR